MKAFYNLSKITTPLWQNLIKSAAKTQDEIKKSVIPLFYTILFVIEFVGMWLPLKLATSHHPYWIFTLPVSMTVIQAINSTEYIAKIHWIPFALSTVFHAVLTGVFIVSDHLITPDLLIGSVICWIVSSLWYWLGFIALRSTTR